MLFWSRSFPGQERIPRKTPAEAGVEWKCGLIYAVSGTCLLHQAVSPEWVYNVCVLLPHSREEQLHSVMPGP